MNKLKITFAILSLAALASLARAQPIGWIPEPVFHQTDFLRLAGVPEFNVDYALVWTDSAAAVFLQPIDAVVLHVEIAGAVKDVFVISDAGMNRLTVWQCTEPGLIGQRTLEKAVAYNGEDSGVRFSHPAGLATNAMNRVFNPASDVVYVADRGNDRIVELGYLPGTGGGQLYFSRSIGEDYLEWPVDVAVSAYGDGIQANADLYVVDMGHSRDDGYLIRFNINGGFEGQWRDLTFRGYEEMIWQILRPFSVACFPDSVVGVTAIYITDGNNTLYYLSSRTNQDPEWSMTYDMEIRTDFWRPGGIALDDYGRIYIANEASGIIEIYGPRIEFLYDAFGELGDGPGQLNYPTNITLDTYHGVCEALILECYERQSGLQTYIVDNGASSTKPLLGFVASGLVRPPSQAAALLPGAFSLNEAYPNPFNSRCLITFSIPVQSNVKIEVFNVLGQKVVTVLDEMRDAGQQSVAFDAGNLSSGVYFYTLKTEGFSKTKSMVLLK